MEVVDCWPAPALPGARGWLAAASAPRPDGGVYAIGGFNRNTKVVANVSVLTAAAADWTAAPSLLVAAAYLGTAAVQRYASPI